MPDHDRTIQTAFTAQAPGFNSSPAQNARVILDALVRAARPAPTESWLDVACGPGIVGRALAPHVAAVHGIDLTPAMVALAEAEAARAGLANASYAVADATAVDDADGAPPAGAYDGAITRYALHHVPVPGRLLAAMARAVRPGGRIVVADHLADPDRDAFAWTQETERLRDPSHWASLTRDGLRDGGERAGLTLEDERIVTLALDFEEWLRRGTDDPTAHALVEQMLIRRPAGTEHFAVTAPGPDARRTLTLQIWIGAWRV